MTPRSSHRRWKPGKPLWATKMICPPCSSDYRVARNCRCRVGEEIFIILTHLDGKLESDVGVENWASSQYNFAAIGKLP